jgi:hypothetical protein
MTASTLYARFGDATAAGAWAVLITTMLGDDSQYAAVRAAISADDTADVPLAQTARDALMPHACGECGTEADAPGREPDHFSWCSRAASRWEVAFGPVDTSINAASAEAAATQAAAEREFEVSGKYYQADPNPAVLVRRAGGGSWQQVYLNPGEVETAVAALKARVHGEDQAAGKSLAWHEGTHAWKQHDGYPRHQHSVNGVLTIAPGDTRLHFSHGPEFREGT